LYFTPNFFDASGQLPLQTLDTTTGLVVGSIPMTIGAQGYSMHALDLDMQGNLWGIMFNAGNPSPVNLFSSIVVPIQIGLTAATLGTAVLLNQDPTLDLGVSLAIFQTACVHGSSMIDINGSTQSRKICELHSGDAIVAADGRHATVERVLPCWLKMPDSAEYHTCVVFEANSLGPGVPTRRFAIDPGHPMCTPEEFYLKGRSALKVASHYLGRSVSLDASSSSSSSTTNDTTSGPSLSIELTDWNTARQFFVGNHERYDLLLSADSCGAYVANGIVVQARQSLNKSGYDHETIATQH
jgi:hypothetical protein